MDFSGSQGGAPLEPFVAQLMVEFSSALDGFGGSQRRRWSEGKGYETGIVGGVDDSM